MKMTKYSDKLINDKQRGNDKKERVEK